MTLPELMDFAKWMVYEAEIEVNVACNCHPEYERPLKKVEAETARWWREHGKGNEG